MPSEGFCGGGVFTGALPEASVNADVPQSMRRGIPVFTVFILLFLEPIWLVPIQPILPLRSIIYNRLHCAISTSRIGLGGTMSGKNSGYARWNVYSVDKSNKSQGVPKKMVIFAKFLLRDADIC